MAYYKDNKLVTEDTKVLTIEEVQRVQEHKRRDRNYEKAKKEELELLAIPDDPEDIPPEVVPVEVVSEEEKYAATLKSYEEKNYGEVADEGEEETKGGKPSKKKLTAKEVKATVNQKLKWMRLGNELGRVRDDADFERRVFDFWDICSKTGEIPQKVDFYMFLGVSASAVYSWKNGQGCSRERTELVKLFDSMYDSVRDTMALKGSVEQLPYIWQSKQWQGYKEPKAELSIAGDNPLQSLPDAAAVKEKYKDLLKNAEVVEVEAVSVTEGKNAKK